MKKQFRIYFEGGGDGRKGKDDLRRAMDDFLKPLKDQARQEGCGWTLVPCGGRASAWSKFKNAVRSYPEAKLNHSTKLLPKVDSTKVRARCPHAERFFTTLESLITN